ncbi:MAG: hypothetical protein M3Y58_15675 [Chloroflexota bacterium]|nr:hypothetical protein [Chloroflexota bacterium]
MAATKQVNYRGATTAIQNTLLEELHREDKEVVSADDGRVVYKAPRGMLAWAQTVTVELVATTNEATSVSVSVEAAKIPALTQGFRQRKLVDATHRLIAKHYSSL